MEKYLQVFRDKLYYLVLGLFVFIPLYPKFPLFKVPGTYVAIRLEDIYIAFVIGLFILINLNKLKNLWRLSITQAVLLYWAIGALSLYSGIFLTQTVTPHLGFLHFLRRVESMSLFFISWYVFQTFGQIKLWLKVMLLTTLFIIIYGFGQQWLSFPVISTTNKEFSRGLILFLTPDARVNSTFAGHYDLAAYLAAFLSVISALIIYLRKDKKIIAAVTALLAFILLAMTAARISFVAAVVGITSILWLSNKRKLILLLVFLILVAFAIFPELRHRTVATLTVNLLDGGGPKYTLPPQKENPTKHFSIENAATGAATPSGVPVDIAPGEPINTTELGVYRSFGIRLNEEWPRAIRAFFKNPILGTGYSSISIATDNDILRQLGETGLLGFTSFFLIWFILIKRIWFFVKQRSRTLIYYLCLGGMAALAALLLNALFIDILESSKIGELLWLFLGVLFAALDIESGKTLARRMKVS